MIVYDELRPVPLFKPFFESSGVHHANHFRNIPTLLLFETKARKKLPPGFFYQDPGCAPDDNKIIVFDTHTTPVYLNWLCQRYPDKRIILWFWNPASLAKNFLRVDPRVEKWCYSERDAQEWNMHLNTQFFFDSLAQDAAKHAASARPAVKKAFFIGREKGRTEQLEQLRNELAEAGVMCDFRLIPLPDKKPRSLREKLTPYGEVISGVKEAQLLVDLYADPTAGLSLRAMEALFFGKKMITNRPQMRNEDFYDPRNIYLLGEEDRTLKSFLEEPYVHPDPAVRDRYLLSNWLKRFDSKEFDV